MKECHNRGKNSVFGMLSRRLWGGLLAALGLWTLSLPAQQIIKYRDRLNLPGVRVTREYLETATARQETPEASADKNSQTTTPRGTASWHPSVVSSHNRTRLPAPSPLPPTQDKKPWDGDAAIRLFQALNRAEIGQVAYQGTQFESADGTCADRTPFFAEVSGAETFHFDYAEEGGGAGASIRFTRETAWVEERGQAHYFIRSAYPEFNPFFPAIGLSWAIRNWQARGELELLYVGKEYLNGLPVHVVDVVHRGESGSSWPQVVVNGGRKERRYRLWLDKSLRPLKLESGGCIYLYGDYRTVERMEVPCRVAFHLGGEKVLEQEIRPEDIKVIEETASLEAYREPAGRDFPLRGGAFGAEKVWKENLPDTMGGETPFGRFTGNSVAEVNLLNLSLNVNIPLADFPQRGNVAAPFGISYTSKLWNVDFLGVDGAKVWRRGRFETPNGVVRTFNHLYSRESRNGWRNQGGLYTLDINAEYYNPSTGQGVSESQVLDGSEIPKMLEKAYVHFPDGSVREFMRAEDEESGNNVDELRNFRDPDGVLCEPVSTRWESTDGGAMRIERGNRGLSVDVVQEGNRLYIADGPAGVKAVSLADPMNPVVESGDATPGGRTAW